MNLARSSFYYRPKAKDPDRMKAEADLRDRIETICLGFTRYGYRRVTYQLKREGKQVNHKKVLRLMRESDLLCRVRRKRVKTTNNRHRFPRYPNLVKGITIKCINQVWLADITYIRIRTGFVYLAAILDAYSRKVIGYADGFTVDFWSNVDTSAPFLRELMLVVTAYWAEVGVHANVLPVEKSAYKKVRHTSKSTELIGKIASDATGLFQAQTVNEFEGHATNLGTTDFLVGHPDVGELERLWLESQGSMDVNRNYEI